jgi:hypothetical protein
MKFTDEQIAELKAWHYKIYNVLYLHKKYSGKSYATNQDPLWIDLKETDFGAKLLDPNLSEDEKTKLAVDYLNRECVYLHDPKFIFHYFTNHVDFYYQNECKWIRRTHDVNPYNEDDFRNYVRWTKDYVMIYFRRVCWFLTTDDFRKFYRVASEIINWPEDRIKD